MTRKLGFGLQVRPLIQRSRSNTSVQPVNCGQLVKMLRILKPHGIFGSNFSYLSIIT